MRNPDFRTRTLRRALDATLATTTATTSNAPYGNAGNTSTETTSP
jgi:hypothetical protein